MHVIGNSPQPIVVDSLPVNACHVVAGVAHDVVDGGEVASFVCDCAERVTQRVEAKAGSVDPGLRWLLNSFSTISNRCCLLGYQWQVFAIRICTHRR